MPNESSMPVTIPRSELLVRHLPELLLLAVIALGIGLRVYYFAPDVSRSPDERTYARQANIVLQHGVNGFQILGEEMNQNPAAAGRTPSPLRIGYITLLASFMRFTGDFTELAGARLSFLCSIATLILLAWSAYRFLSSTVAIVATLLLAVLPFDIAVSRRSWEEALISLLAVSLLMLATLIGRTRSNTFRYAYLGAFALLGFFSFMVKENSGITFLLCSGGLSLFFIFQRERRNALLTVLTAVTAAVACVVVLSALFGGLAHVVAMVREYEHYSAINAYVAAFDTGTRGMFLAGWFRSSPFVLCTAVIGFVVTLYRVVRTRSFAFVGLRLGIALFTAAMFLVQLILQRFNFRHSAPLYGSLCLLAGIGAAACLTLLCRWFAPFGRVATWIIIVSSIAVGSFYEVAFARDKIIVPGMQDLALRPIAGAEPLPVPLNILAAAASSTDSPQDVVNLALSYIQGNQPERAIPLLNSVLSRDSGNYVTWNNLCVASTMLHAYSAAIEACKHSLSIAPEFQLARNNLKWAQDESSKADIAARVPSAISVRDASSYLAEGLDELHAGSYDKAIQSWKHTLALDPGSALAANNIGTAYMMKKQPIVAIPWFEKAIKMDGTLQIAKNNLAWAYAEEQKPTGPADR
jgi:Tfp pilus assembly protein PilF